MSFPAVHVLGQTESDTAEHAALGLALGVALGVATNRGETLGEEKIMGDLLGATDCKGTGDTFFIVAAPEHSG